MTKWFIQPLFSAIQYRQIQLLIVLLLFMTTGCRVEQTTPSEQQQVSPGLAVITVTFSHSTLMSSVNKSVFQLNGPNGNAVINSVTKRNRMAILTLQSPMQTQGEYQLHISGVKYSPKRLFEYWYGRSFNFLDGKVSDSPNHNTRFSVIENNDHDNDGVVNSEDAFPLDPTETLDTDNDGIGNNADTDDDGDGVGDTADVFPLDANETTDTDRDGIGNNADTDDDGDGVADDQDAFPLDLTETHDTDKDGVGNNADTDDDNDNIIDISDPFPLNGNHQRSAFDTDKIVLSRDSQFFSSTGDWTATVSPESSNGTAHWQLALNSGRYHIKVYWVASSAYTSQAQYQLTINQQQLSTHQLSQQRVIPQGQWLNTITIGEKEPTTLLDIALINDGSDLPLTAGHIEIIKVPDTDQDRIPDVIETQFGSDLWQGGTHTTKTPSPEWQYFSNLIQSQPLTANTATPSNNALSLSGAGHVVTPIQLTLSKPFTLMYWLKPTSLQPWQASGYKAANNPNTSLWLGIHQRRIEVQYGGQRISQPLPNDIQAKHWLHVAVVLQTTPTPTLLLYLNGQVIKQQPVSLVSEMSGILRLGAVSTTHAHLDGELDEALIWQRALSKENIQQAMYQPSKQQSWNALQGIYNFDDHISTGRTAVAIHYRQPQVFTGLLQGQITFSSRAQTDSDNDGLPNYIEQALGFNQQSQDTDGDTITDYQEYLQGTNPKHPDSDRDNIPDNVEIQLGSNPQQPDSQQQQGQYTHWQHYQQWLQQTPPQSTAKSNNSLYFNANNQHGLITPFQEGHQGFSLLLWLKLDHLTQSYFATGTDNGNQAKIAIALSQGKLSVSLDNTNQQLPLPQSITAGEWFHLAVTYDPSVEKSHVYINGQLQSHAKTLLLQANATPLAIGYINGQGASTLSHGVSLDDMQLWQSSLSATDVAYYMASNPDKSHQYLFALYDFNQFSHGFLSHDYHGTYTLYWPAATSPTQKTDRRRLPAITQYTVNKTSTKVVVNWQPIQYATHYRIEHWLNHQWTLSKATYPYTRITITEDTPKIRMAACLGQQCGGWLTIEQLDTQRTASDKAHQALYQKGITPHPTANLTLSSGIAYLTADSQLYRVDNQQNVVSYSLPGLLVNPPLHYKNHLYLTLTDINGQGQVCRTTMDLQQWKCHRFSNSFRVTPAIVTGSPNQIAAVSHNGEVILFSAADFTQTQQLSAIQIENKPAVVTAPIIITKDKLILQLRSHAQQQYVYAFDPNKSHSNNNNILQKITAQSGPLTTSQLVPEWITALGNSTGASALNTTNSQTSTESE